MPSEAPWPPRNRLLRALWHVHGALWAFMAVFTAAAFVATIIYILYLAFSAL